MKNNKLEKCQYDYSNHINNSTIINMIILIILIIVLLLSLSLINKTLKKKETILEEVKLQENTTKNDGFALMLQQNDGTYKESTSNSWPTGMKFNSELSGCIDTNGKRIEDSLSFDKENNIVNVSVGETSYCYVYFDKQSSNEYLIDNVSTEELWKSTLEDDGYRYVGTNPNNYICFGTSDKDICINDTDKYMYRIIGIFEDSSGNKHAKLIKKEALNTKYAWNSNYYTDADWNNSDLYKGINGNYFLTNTSYSYMQDSNWTDKIATWNYTMTNTKTYENYANNSVYGPAYLFQTVKAMYLHELNRSGKTNENCYYIETGETVPADCNAGEWKTLNAKISLMYVSDYALSLGEESLNYTATNNCSTLKTGWMHLSNNDSQPPYDTEWTMTREGEDGLEAYIASTIRSDGLIEWRYTGDSIAVRPVFYLDSNVEFIDYAVEGSITDPYIIK